MIMLLCRDLIGLSYGREDSGSNLARTQPFHMSDSALFVEMGTFSRIGTTEPILTSFSRHDSSDDEIEFKPNEGVRQSPPRSPASSVEVRTRSRKPGSSV